MTRYDGTNWGDTLPPPVRWNGTDWVNTSSGKVWDGTEWVPIITAGQNPPYTFWYSFNGGTDGADVTTSHQDSGTPWDNVSFPYVNFSSPGKDGTGLCGEVPAGAVQTSQLQWDGTGTDKIQTGFWFNVAQAPTGDTRLYDIRNTSSSGTTGGLLLRSDLTLRLMVSTNGQVPYTSPAITTGNWYWVSFGINFSTGSFRIVVYDSTGNVFYDTGVATASWPYTTPGTVRFGRVTSAGDIGLTKFDWIMTGRSDSTIIPPWGI